MRILVVEDDPSLLAYIGETVTTAGYRADLERDGAEGLRLAASSDFDCVVLDRMLPKCDGLSIVRALRAMSVETPILILTALGAERERVAGLDETKTVAGGRPGLEETKTETP